jgi:hypothetical protein
MKPALFHATEQPALRGEYTKNIVRFDVVRFSEKNRSSVGF